MNKLGFHLIGKPNENFESCSDCIHADDSEEICILRKCVHAIKYLYDCYEKAEQKTGKWMIEDCHAATYQYCCSECNAHHRARYDFCPTCGCRMEVKNNGCS